MTIIIENHHHSSIDICCIVHGFICHATYNSLHDDDDDVGANECRGVILTQTYADDDDDGLLMTMIVIVTMMIVSVTMMRLMMIKDLMIIVTGVNRISI